MQGGACDGRLDGWCCARACVSRAPSPLLFSASCIPMGALRRSLPRFRSRRPASSRGRRPSPSRPGTTSASAIRANAWSISRNRRPVTLTKATWNAILEVNRRVNAAIAPLSDHDHWGALDRWDLPSDGYGDCEDFQLLKRRLLADQGLPRRAMRMTVVINRQGEGHAVLMVRTDPGDLILDNQRSAVLPWDQTGYHLREARKPGDRRVGLLGRACLTHLHGEPIASPAGAAVLIGRLRASRRRGLDPGTRPTIQEPWSPSSAHEAGAAEQSYKDMFIS